LIKRRKKSGVMKKKKKPEQKKKDFIHTPFNALKGFAAEKHEAEEKAKEAPKPEKKEVVEGERDLFLRSMSDVKRLAPEKAREKKKEAAPPPPSKIDEEEKRLFAETMKKMDVRFEDEIPDVHPLRPVAVNRMRQLKSGAIRIDLELDLHGMTRDEALESIGHFITGAYNRGQKAVLVITGKGNNSPGEPVLQGAVMSWLRETGKKMVAEFAPAPHQLGGSGALVVFLKDKDKISRK
jgi:DNA-nicking Smr family endonuclease